MWILHPQESCKVLIKQNEDVRFYERIKKYREKKENARKSQVSDTLGQVSDTLPEKVILQRKSFGKGINPDMTEGMVVATTINASHQTS